MKLDRVTITGADDSIRPEQLIPISEKYPFVEWGILASRNNKSPRFPSLPWVSLLRALAAQSPLALSLHLCGSWVRELLLGRVQFDASMLDESQRVQLNFHSENSRCNGDEFAERLGELGQQQFIFQIDGAGGNRHFESVLDRTDGLDCVPLFDISGGAGISPDSWPTPIHRNDDGTFIYHGYAGGLGPDNLEAELKRIADSAGDCPIWIDMETKVRGPESVFDLTKVERCLEIASNYIGLPATV